MNKEELYKMPYRVTQMLLEGITSVVKQEPDQRIEIESEPFYDEQGRYISSDIVALYIDEKGQCCVEREDRWTDGYLYELSLNELSQLIADL